MAEQHQVAAGNDEDQPDPNDNEGSEGTVVAAFETSMSFDPQGEPGQSFFPAGNTDYGYSSWQHYQAPRDLPTGLPAPAKPSSPRPDQPSWLGETGRPPVLGSQSYKQTRHSLRPLQILGPPIEFDNDPPDSTRSSCELTDLGSLAVHITSSLPLITHAFSRERGYLERIPNINAIDNDYNLRCVRGIDFDRREAFFYHGPFTPEGNDDVGAAGSSNRTSFDLADLPRLVKPTSPSASMASVVVDLGKCVGSGAFYDVFKVGSVSTTAIDDQRTPVATPLSDLPFIARAETSPSLIAKVCSLAKFPTSREKQSTEWLRSEARVAVATEAYIIGTHLKDLQGSVVPTLHGLYGSVVYDREYWVMIMSDCGIELSSDVLRSDPKYQSAVLSAYERVHAAGVVHSDINSRHWLFPPTPVKTEAESSAQASDDLVKVTLIDFDRSKTINSFSSAEEFEKACKREIDLIKYQFGVPLPMDPKLRGLPPPPAWVPPSIRPSVPPRDAPRSIQPPFPPRSPTA